VSKFYIVMICVHLIGVFSSFCCCPRCAMQAYCYKYGLGVRKNEKKAAELEKKADDLDD
jgi:hypothetical protein